MRIIIDGELVADHEATVPATDWGVIRGFGCFEVVRVYDGTPFRLGPHLDRFANSAELLGLGPIDREGIARWAEQLAEGDCLIRFYLTGGSRDPDHPTPPRTVVVREQLPALPDILRVLPLPAPWHPAGAATELAGAKTLSYANNMAASLAAQQRGFDDALLLAAGDTVLEGPTFSVGWFRDGTLNTPSLELGILASITRHVALDLARSLGMEVGEGRFSLDDALAADEVFALSTVKEVMPVGRIGDRELKPGALTAKLASAFAAAVAAEVGA